MTVSIIGISVAKLQLKVNLMGPISPMDTSGTRTIHAYLINADQYGCEIQIDLISVSI